MRTSIPAICRAAAIACAILFASSPASAQSDGSDPASVMKRIDPTDFHSRFELRNEYQEPQSGGYVNFLVPRVEYAVSKSLSLRLEIPLVTRNTDQPGTDTDTGIGSTTMRVSWRAMHSENYAVVAGTELILDTATQQSLSSGKDVLAPFAYGSIKIMSLNSVFFPFLQYYFTIGGDSSRTDVDYLSIKPVVLTILPDRYYTVVEPHFIVDRARSDKVGLTLETELGRFVEKNLMVYGRPGVGLYGDNLPQVYNWNFEVGFRYIFR